MRVILITTTIYLLLFVSSKTYANDTTEVEADPYPIQYELAPNSDIKAEKVKSRVWYMINFSGLIQFDAKYLVEFDDSRKTKLIIVLKPKTTLKNIIKIKDRGKNVEINEFYIGEDPKSIKNLLGKENYQKMMAGEIRKMSGQAKFEIDGFSTYYECDVLVYGAAIKKIQNVYKAANVELADGISGC